jgi:hypothetical protein
MTGRRSSSRHFKQLYEREIVLFAHVGSDSLNSIHGTEGFSIPIQAALNKEEEEKMWASHS